MLFNLCCLNDNVYLKCVARNVQYSSANKRPPEDQFKTITCDATTHFRLATARNDAKKEHENQAVSCDKRNLYLEFDGIV